jgi:hypothetical protein
VWKDRGVEGQRDIEERLRVEKFTGRALKGQ